jgi:hypothetical protein
MAQSPRLRMLGQSEQPVNPFLSWRGMNGVNWATLILELGAPKIENKKLSTSEFAIGTA